LPSVAEIVDALEEAYAGNYKPQDARNKALEYDHANVYRSYWHPILKHLQEIHDNRT